MNRHPVRVFATAIAAVTLVASGAYVFIYLERWEWNRALISGMFFIAAEIAVATVVLANRLTPVPATGDRRAGRALGRLEATAPAPRDQFAWLRHPARMNVFLPIMLGAGVVLSGVAWGVERIAHLTAGPVLERRLARRLDTLSTPDSLVPAPVTVDRLRRPHPRPR